MEATSPIPTPTPAAPTVAPAPVVEATPVAPMQPMVQQSALDSSMDSGSSGSDGSVKAFLKNVNWLEVIITSLGLTALIYTIHYYRFKSKEDKMINNELQRQIDELKMNLQSAMKKKYKSI
jgi:hypothetical protein